MSVISRRNFLQASLAAGVNIGFAGLVNRLNVFNAYGQTGLINEAKVYGKLSPRAANNTGEMCLSLPPGFQ